MMPRARRLRPAARAARRSGARARSRSILLSARAGEEARIEGLQAGADDYLVKPFSARELLARVSTHLQLARLRASAEAERRRLFAIFAQAPVAIAVLRGPEHTIELANEHYCAMVGRRAVDVVGRTLLQVFPELAGTEAYANHDRILATGEPYTTPEYGVTIDRGHGLEQRYYNASSVPLRNAMGAIDSIVLVAADTTEQVRARHELAALTVRLEEVVGTLSSVFDNAPVGIALFDRDLRFAQINRALAEMNGLPIEAHLGRRLPDVLPHLPPELEGQLRVVLATGRPLVDLEIRGRTPASPDERIWEASWFPVKRGESEVIGVGGVVIEVTDRRRAEEVRERAARFAQQFMGILGHDLRNPLSSIAMASALLKRKLEGTAETRTVERITSSANRMSRMVSQLLDLTRGRLIGGIPIEPQRANLSDVVLAAVDELRTAFPTRVVRCRVPAAVDGGWDTDRLAQVVSNLVGNAIQHGEPGLPVEVDLEDDGDRVTLRVQNHGPPIPADLLPVLFEPFRRGPQDAGGKTPSGLGLGLYISEQVVRAHGGSIRVESDADATVFTVTMPIRAAGIGPDRDLP